MNSERPAWLETSESILKFSQERASDKEVFFAKDIGRVLSNTRVMLAAQFINSKEMIPYLFDDLIVIKDKLKIEIAEQQATLEKVALFQRKPDEDQSTFSEGDGNKAMLYFSLWKAPTFEDGIKTLKVQLEKHSQSLIIAIKHFDELVNLIKQEDKDFSEKMASRALDCIGFETVKSDLMRKIQEIASPTSRFRR